MEPKLNPELKRILSNPEIGGLITKGVLNNNNKISPITLEFLDQGIVLELIPIGYTGKQNNPDKK